MMLQSTPAEPHRPALEQCYRDVRSICIGAPDGGQCQETGRQACDMVHGDPERTRSLGGANLRKATPSI